MLYYEHWQSRTSTLYTASTSLSVKLNCHNGTALVPPRRNKPQAKCISQLGILKFQTLLMVVLLFICTCTYLHGVFPAFLDRNKAGYVTSRGQQSDKKSKGLQIYS